MPISVTTPVDIREQIALMALHESYTITEVADLFGVTRPTVYKYRDRYRAEGRAGLVDRSKAPRTAHCTDADVVKCILDDRRRFKFGSKKIRRRLVDSDPDATWPARSTIDAILKRAGLVTPRRGRSVKYASPFRQRYDATEPGDLQTIDFKGEFRLRTGRWCHPLTMADAVSRFFLACQALPTTALALVWPVVERVFRENGLPAAMLSDNGPPFGAHGTGRLSTFSVRLMELGVQPVFIVPGHPEQNGRHERMHLTLKQSDAVRPARSLREQQRAFDDFRKTYNEERPHEGIDLDRPARRHRSSNRPYPEAVPRIEYDSSLEVRTVSANGLLKWGGYPIFLSHALAARRVAMELVDDRLWNVYLGKFLIGKLDEKQRRFV